jgi:hypothetical protein
MDRVFLTFGDGRTGWRKASKRIEQEARQTSLFEITYNFDFKSILEISPETAIAIVAQRENGGFRGFGYWLWKPAILRWAHQVHPNSHIVYIDSGSHIVNGGESPDFSSILKKSEQAGGLAWDLPGHNENSWTKRELVEYMNPPLSLLVSDQVQSGFISLPPSTQRNEFVKSWYDISLQRNGFFFTDEVGPNQHQDFIEHRHDQSSMSLLWKSLSMPTEKDCTFPSIDNQCSLIAARNNTALPINESALKMKVARYTDLAVDVLTKRR